MLMDCLVFGTNQESQHSSILQGEDARHEIFTFLFGFNLFSPKVGA
jgi:hypothetical protein